MVKQFKGQVKIADVQKAFDEIIGRTNKMIDAYNNSSYVKDIDYSKGSPILAPNGYTLTVGGLKQLLKITDGFVLGCKPFNIGNKKMKVTAGILSTKDNLYSLPDAIVDIPTVGNYRTLYYNTVIKQYQWTPEGTSSVVVSEIKRIGSLMHKYKDDNYVLPKAQAGSLLAINDTYGHSVIVLDRYNPDEQTPENFEETKVVIPVEAYPHICSDVFLQGDNTEIEVGIPSNLSFYEIDANICQVMMGSLQSDGKTFIPRAYIRGLSQAWNNVFANYSDFDKVEYTEISTGIGKKNALRPIPSSNFSENGDYLDRNRHDIKKVVYSFSKSSISDNAFSLITSFKDANNKDVVPPVITPLNFNIGDLGINCLIFVARPDGIVNNVEDTEQYGELFYRPQDFKLKMLGMERTLNVNGQDVITNRVEMVETGDAAYKVCEINPNAESKFMSSIAQVQAEKVDGKFEITCESKHRIPVAPETPVYGNEPIDTSKGAIFAVGLDTLGEEHSASIRNNCYLLGKLISWNKYAGHRHLDYWTPINILFLPKGCPNPFTFSPTIGGVTKVFKVLINKVLKHNE